MINSNFRNHRRLPRRDDTWAQLLIVTCDFIGGEWTEGHLELKDQYDQKTIRTTKTSWN